MLPTTALPMAGVDRHPLHSSNPSTPYLQRPRRVVRFRNAHTAASSSNKTRYGVIGSRNCVASSTNNGLPRWRIPERHQRVRGAAPRVVASVSSVVAWAPFWYGSPPSGEHDGSSRPTRGPLAVSPSTEVTAPGARVSVAESQGLAPVRVRIIKTEAEFAALAADWERLQ